MAKKEDNKTTGTSNTGFSPGSFDQSLTHNVASAPNFPKEKGVFGNHKVGCKCVMCERVRAKANGESKESVLADKLGVPSHLKEQIKLTPKVSEPVIDKGDMQDALDQSLGRCKYSLNEHEVAIWRNDETQSAMHTPPELKKKYPDFAWHYVSVSTLETKGVGYNAWELFKDREYPNGVNRGPDMKLGFMPKRLSAERKKKFEDRSSELVANLPQGQILRIEEAMANSKGGIQPLKEGDEVGRSFISEGMLITEHQGKRVPGLLVGQRAAIARQGHMAGRPAQHRGISPEKREFYKEKMAKLREKPNRTIFT